MNDILIDPSTNNDIVVDAKINNFSAALNDVTQYINNNYNQQKLEQDFNNFILDEKQKAKKYVEIVNNLTFPDGLKTTLAVEINAFNFVFNNSNRTINFNLKIKKDTNTINTKNNVQTNTSFVNDYQFKNLNIIPTIIKQSNVYLPAIGFSFNDSFTQEVLDEQINSQPIIQQTISSLKKSSNKPDEQNNENYTYLNNTSFDNNKIYEIILIKKDSPAPNIKIESPVIHLFEARSSNIQNVIFVPLISMAKKYNLEDGEQNIFKITTQTNS